MVSRKTKNSSSKKSYVIGLVIVLLIVAGVGAYITLQHKPKVVQSTATTTSHLKTAQNNYSSGAPRDASSNTAAAGGAQDTKGAASASTTNDPSTWTTSPSGLITLENPISGQLVTNGMTISGKASVNAVQFRIVDDTSGVIAQSQLSVVSGAFSGTLQFKAYGTTGKLDVFSYDSNGAEINELSIPIKLQP